MNEISTMGQYREVVSNCRTMFLKKTADYGTSWRVYRIISVADQLYIKAKRIRNIQELKRQEIGDDIRSEFEGIYNYSIIGLIQLSLPDEPEELSVEEVTRMYDEKVLYALDLLSKKNHDYGEAWREMSQESYADLILAKVLRIKQISANAGKTIASEGIDSNFYDIMNYAAFALIMISEGRHAN